MSDDLSFSELRLANLLHMRHESIIKYNPAEVDPMELAEAVITADRIAAAHGVDLAQAIKKWFDEARIHPSPEPQPQEQIHESDLRR